MHKQSSYSWINLVHFLLRKQYFHNGLTIPFLIGAIKLLDRRTLTVSEFINELINSEQKVTIMKCDDIGEYVIGTLDYESEKFYEKSSNSLYRKFKNLFVIDDSLSEYKSIESLIDFMERKYSEIVMNKKYSKNAGQWTDFTEQDIKRIREYQSNT